MDHVWQVLVQPGSGQLTQAQLLALYASHKAAKAAVTGCKCLNLDLCGISSADEQELARQWVALHAAAVGHLRLDQHMGAVLAASELIPRRLRALSAHAVPDTGRLLSLQGSSLVKLELTVTAAALAATEGACPLRLEQLPQLQHLAITTAHCRSLLPASMVLDRRFAMPTGAPHLGELRSLRLELHNAVAQVVADAAAFVEALPGRRLERVLARVVHHVANGPAATEVVLPETSLNMSHLAAVTHLEILWSGVQLSLPPRLHELRYHCTERPSSSVVPGCSPDRVLHICGVFPGGSTQATEALLAAAPTRHLTSLAFTFCNLTGSTVQAVARLADLRELTVEDCSMLEAMDHAPCVPTDTACLSALSALTRLHVSDSKCGFVQHLTGLEALSLYPAYLMHFVGGGSLCGLKWLTSLELLCAHEPRDGEAVAMALQMLPRFKRLTVSTPPADVDAMKHCLQDKARSQGLASSCVSVKPCKCPAPWYTT